MARITISLEAAVAAVLADTDAEGTRPTARQRANVDKAFTAILGLIAPRIRHFIRQYGLIAHREDAEQCCAIAVHRAIQAYDPAKAQFTTFVNWQIRGELQALRFRVMTDQRPSARKVAATTISLDAPVTGPDGQQITLAPTIEDEDALALTESAASDYLANAATAALVAAFAAEARTASLGRLRQRPACASVDAVPRDDAGAFEQLEHKLALDRRIVERVVFETGAADHAGAAGVTKDRVRLVTRRATRSMAAIAQKRPRFALMADYRH